MKTQEWHLCICLDLFLWVPLYFEAVSSSYGQGTVFGPKPAMWKLLDEFFYLLY